MYDNIVNAGSRLIALAIGGGGKSRLHRAKGRRATSDGQPLVPRFRKKAGTECELTHFESNRDDHFPKFRLRDMEDG